MHTVFVLYIDFQESVHSSGGILASAKPDATLERANVRIKNGRSGCVRRSPCGGFPIKKRVTSINGNWYRFYSQYSSEILYVQI